jgi:hypothetical protein
MRHTFFFRSATRMEVGVALLFVAGVGGSGDDASIVLLPNSSRTAMNC